MLLCSQPSWAGNQLWPVHHQQGVIFSPSIPALPTLICGAGLRAEAAPFSTSSYMPNFPEWNANGGLPPNASSSTHDYGSSGYNFQQDPGMYGYGGNGMTGFNGHQHQAGAQPWATNSHMTPDAFQGRHLHLYC